MNEISAAPPHPIEPEHVEHAPGVTWGPLTAVVASVLIYFISQYGAALVILIYPITQQWNTAQATNWLNSSVLAQFVNVLLIEALVILLLRWFLNYKKSSFKAIGWARKLQWTDVGYAFAAFGAYLVLLNYVVFNIAQKIVPHINYNQKQDIGFNNSHGSVLVLVFISLAILPPLVEETLVRGFLYTGLKAKLPKFTAAIITSLLFAAAHLELGSGQPALWSAAIDTFTLSLFLVYLREKTGSLYASVGLHFLKNSLAFAALYLFHIN